MQTQNLRRAIGISLIAAALAMNSAPAQSDGSETALAQAGEQPEQKKSSATDSSTPPKARPAYSVIRADEDWSGFDGRDRGWDALKNIPLGESGTVRATFGGQIRVRGEYWDDFAFGGPGRRDDGFGLLRLRLHGDVWAGRHFRLFVEGKSALATGRRLPGGNRSLDTDSAALQAALVDVKIPLSDDASLTFRAGRRELKFGKQRLVSPLDWSNTRPRSFDGFGAVVQTGDWKIDGFWTRHVRTRKYRFNPHDAGVDFFGVYAEGKAAAGHSLDLYWLGWARDRAVFGGVGASERRHTLGARYEMQKAAPFSVEVESAYQLGTFGDADIRAFMATGVVRFSLPGPLTSPSLSLGFDYAGGDDSPSDDRLGTFNQLYPLGHAYLGLADFVGRQNIVDFSQTFAFQPVPKLSLRIDNHLFWRADKADALYNAGGGVVRPADPTASKYVGSELDLTLARPVSLHLLLSAGFSHFFAGDFLRETGPGENVDFLYFQAQYTF